MSFCTSLAEVASVTAEPKGAFLIKGRNAEEKTCLLYIATSFRLIFFLQTDLYNLFQQVKNNLLILYRLLTLLNLALVQRDLKPKSLPSVRGFCKDCLLQKCI